MSRLLFAAARGARIEWQILRLSGKWHPAMSLNDAQSEVGQATYRIHPADDYLQYGPVSTQLRNYALGLKFLNGTCWFARLELHSDGDLYTLSPNDRCVFFLLMAEALADEGM